MLRVGKFNCPEQLGNYEKMFCFNVWFRKLLTTAFLLSVVQSVFCMEIKTTFLCENVRDTLSCREGTKIWLYQSRFHREDDRCGRWRQNCPNEIDTFRYFFCNCESNCSIFSPTTVEGCLAYRTITYECIDQKFCGFQPDTTTHLTTPATTSTKATTTTTTIMTTTTTTKPATTVTIGLPLATTAITNRSILINTSTVEFSTMDSFSSSAPPFPWIPILVAFVLLFLIVTILIVLHRYKQNYINKCCYIGKNNETLSNEVSISTNNSFGIGQAEGLNDKKDLYCVIEPQLREMVENILYVPSLNEISVTQISSWKHDCSKPEENTIYENEYPQVRGFDNHMYSMCNEQSYESTENSQNVYQETSRNLAESKENSEREMVDNILYNTIIK